ncbi:MAG TPA: hypothetical protein VHJ34_15015 [Actinomycetota bacterium]|nr:hypothetical protein [Actinomycetota bacterium]
MTPATHRLGAVAAALAVVLVAAGTAEAAWRSNGSGAGFAKARSMPSGNAPTASASNRSVTVSWPQSSFHDGTAIASYSVARYDAATGVAQPVLSSCAGVVTALTCTENGVPPGSWKYAVTPTRGNWRGAESARSAAVTIAAPVLAFTSPTTVTALPTTLDATLSGFAPGQTVAFRLGNPASGQVLQSTVTPASIPASGSAAATVTIPKGVANHASHTVYAVGSGGDAASAVVSVAVPAPTPTDVLLRNSQNVVQAGRPKPGDTIEVTYSQAMDVASLCSTWANDAANQSVTANDVVRVEVLDDAAPSGNDLIRVTTTAAACGGQFRFGAVDMGSPLFVVGGNATFSGAAPSHSTIAWDAGARRLVVKLGARSGGVNPGKVAVPVTAVYTPDPAMLSSSGIAITGTASRTALQF